MGCAVYFSLAIFVLTGSMLADAHLQRYVPLVSNVQKYYKSHSVFFVYSRKDRYLDEYRLVHLLSRDFSRKYVFTLIVNFEELAERLNWYRIRIGRPLIVVLLRSVSDILEFAEYTRATNVSYPIWLVIFTNEFSEALCEHCENPTGNIFLLRFDTEMLVLCCGNPILREWWAVREDRTEMLEFASYSEGGELELSAVDGLYSRRNDVKGAPLVIGVVSNSALVYEKGDRIEGLFGDVLTELKRAMNFTIAKVIRDSGFGTWNPKKKMWNGIVGRVTRGEADLGVADFTITGSRLGIVDYTFPLMVSVNQLFVKDPDGSDVQWSAYFKAFSISVWAAIILLIITATALLTTIKAHKSSVSLPSLVVENYLYVWGIFCQQGLCEFPASTSLRIAYFSIFVSALIVSASYSASLVSFLTVSSSSLPFTSLQGFANDGTYKLIVFQNDSHYDLFMTSQNPVMKKMSKLMKPVAELPVSLLEGWEKVCHQKVALYTNDVSRKTSNVDIGCKLVAIDSGRRDILAMITPPGSQYSRVINHHLQTFHDAGVINRLKMKYFKKSESAEPKFDVVNLWGVAPILATLTCGMIFATSVLLLEKIIRYLKKNKTRGSRRSFDRIPSAWLGHSRRELRKFELASSKIVARPR